MYRSTWEEAIHPSPSQVEELQANYDQHCEKAADALVRADVFLLVTGAGFSADSGLAVYADVAKIKSYQDRGLDYSDICQPHWLESDPELFYGFWGQCFNDYRKTKPHEGYDIVAHWRHLTNSREGGAIANDIRKRVKRKVQLRRPFDDDETQLYTPYKVTDGPAGAFYSFTSNVDAHFYDKFHAHEIYECHGNIELWQCTNRDKCSSGIWRAPLEHCFTVDPKTMLAPPSKDASVEEESKQALEESEVSAPRIGHTSGLQRTAPLGYMPLSNDTKGWFQEEDSNNWPTCGHCNSLARPAILMFGDYNWKKDFSQYKRWELWTEALSELCEKRRETNPLKVCILEIGCGLNVPTGRFTSEEKAIQLEAKGGDVTLIRINRDFPLASDDVSENLIPIMSTGLRAIKQIDKHYNEKTGQNRIN